MPIPIRGPDPRAISQCNKYFHLNNKGSVGQRQLRSSGGNWINVWVSGQGKLVITFTCCQSDPGSINLVAAQPVRPMSKFANLSPNLAMVAGFVSDNIHSELSVDSNFYTQSAE